MKTPPGPPPTTYPRSRPGTSPQPAGKPPSPRTWTRPLAPARRFPRA